MTQPRPRIGRPQPTRSTDDVLAMIDSAVESPFQVGQQTAGDVSYGGVTDVGLCWRCLQADADPASATETCADCSEVLRSEAYVAEVEQMAGGYVPFHGLRVARARPRAAWTINDIMAMYLGNGPRRIVDDDPFAGLELTIFPRVGAVDRWARRAFAWARALPRRVVQTFARDVLMRFAVWLIDSTTPPAPPAAGWPIGGQRTAPSLNHWSAGGPVAVVAARQVGRTEATRRMAASLGLPLPPEFLGRPSGPLIIDEPGARPETRSVMRDVLARRRGITQPLCHAVIEQDGTVHQVVPDREDPDV